MIEYSLPRLILVHIDYKHIAITRIIERQEGARKEQRERLISSNDAARAFSSDLLPFKDNIALLLRIQICARSRCFRFIFYCSIIETESLKFSGVFHLHRYRKHRRQVLYTLNEITFH